MGIFGIVALPVMKLKYTTVKEVIFAES